MDVVDKRLITTRAELDPSKRPRALPLDPSWRQGLQTATHLIMFIKWF
jgi:hypothetical protein